MSADSLLLWMSARLHGSWAQFRAAVEELHVDAEIEDEGQDDDAVAQLPRYHTLRFNLQRMGHAEFFAGAGEGKDWRVAPPALAVSQREHSWLGVVAGARSLALTERIVQLVADVGATMRTYTLPSYPRQLVMTATSRDMLVAIADRANLCLQDDAPAALLGSLPPVDDPMVRRQAELPFGSDWRVERFSAAQLAWRASTLDDARAAPSSLFRFTLRHQRQVLLCRKGVAEQIPGQVGKYLVLRKRRRQVLRHDAQERTLSLPANCRPPFLVERALILCSGTPPSYERSGQGRGMLRYVEIPQDIATIAAALLRQELR